MDESMSGTESPGESGSMTPDQTSLERQRASLQAYLDSVPYTCESLEEMQERLEQIVGKIAICAKTKNWLVLTTWDGMLQCWLLMRYPMVKTVRAKLVRLYYELCLLPGVEPRVVRSWADMLSRLLSNKPGLKRKLETNDLQLPWQPLWRILQKELWPKKSVQDSSRNVVNILLYVAEQCKRYFPASEIPEMLSAFFPLLTKDSVLTMVPVLTSFLPPTHTHLYLPSLFKLWEAFNSSVVDDRLLDLAGDLSEEHVAAKFGDAGEEGGAAWREVGMWSEAEWTILVGKGLGSMNVPIGATRGSSSTAGHADSQADRQSLRIKKSVSRYHAIAKILVYSMAVDGVARENTTGSSSTVNVRLPAQNSGYLAGSKALDSLDRIITSTESFFHPSNSGPWTLSLATFIQRLATEFSKRWKEEEQTTCKTPVTHRLTPAIRKAFVTVLRTPALLAMFSKDPMSMGYAQGSLHTLALLEPNLIMPELLERAYGGLEIVNETHRTTAVLSMLSGIARPLVSDKVWFGGQKHLVPLLELCIPGIDLNDPVKTVCATMFIVSVVQHIKIGDLSIHQSGLSLSSDAPGEELMDLDDTQLPDGTDAGDVPSLSKEDERALVRDSTAGFADWVTSLFRRVLALYENLPEEGGKKNTTGGKQEESVLKSIKSMLDVVCLHLSDPLFDLVLRLVYDYATTNAKSNSVRAFGQLVACLARVKPEKTMEKFLPFCISQIEDELKHGASSVRTTSSHKAVPSDTTLHWNIAILRGCLGYGGAVLLKYKSQILALLVLLVEKTKSERGFSGTGRLLARILHTLVGVYPLNSRFVNSDEWESEEFTSDHNAHWGRLYEAQDVVVEWHVPSNSEVAFVLDILDQIAKPAMEKVDLLLNSTASWDNVARNDFVRYLHTCRAIWSGLPTLLQEQAKVVSNPCLNDSVEIGELLVTHLNVEAGFTLTDPSDLRYQKVADHKRLFGEVIQRAASTLRQSEGEDHIDAVIEVTRAIDVYLLDYGLNRGNFDALQKNYAQARDLNRMWSKQKENSRLVFVKRAQVYHSGRVYMHALYRRRSAMDDKLLMELVELSLSSYQRVRRHAQSVLHNACGYYVRSTRLTLPSLFDALTKGNDPDRMKGALYILWNKGTAAYALADQGFHGRYLLSLLECQHEEKPSVQKLVNSLAQDCLVHLNEEVVHTDAYSLPTLRVENALLDLEAEFSSTFIDQALLKEATKKELVRFSERAKIYNETITAILEVALRPKTHWRYVQMASRFLLGLLRRDVPTSPDVVKFFIDHTISPQPTIRVNAQRAIVKLATFIKMRTYASSNEELWLDEWSNPLRKQVVITDPATFLASLDRPISEYPVYIDKIETGFITWTPTIKGYSPVEDLQPFSWETQSQPSLQALSEVISQDDYFTKLSLLWSQESNRTNNAIELRSENVNFVKTLAKMFQHESLSSLLAITDPLLSDSDKFKQRAGAEFLIGLLRGSKHWPRQLSENLWEWIRTRLDRIFAQIKPDTLSFWESAISYQLQCRDPRRNQILIDWILALPLEFHGDSAFSMSKTLSVFGILVDGLGLRFNSMSNRYVNLFFDNANTGYAEVRAHIAQNLYMITRSQWMPSYPSPAAFLQACRDSKDPLYIRSAKYSGRVNDILKQLPKWKEERLPPPRVSQSEYDKVGLTLLQWIWVAAHGAQACLVFPYAVPMMPEILQMSELNDSSELQTYSSAVLYVISAVSPPQEFIEVILENFVVAIKSSTSWRIRLHALPALVVFFYRNLLSMSPLGISKVMDVLLDCLSDENVEVREMASKVLSGIVRCSQRQSIVPLKNRFVKLARKTTLPQRRDPTYSESLRSLHSAILGLCALIESFPYSVEPWMPSLTEVLAPHATDPPPISTTIRKTASEFKKTHQDTWHKDQLLFDEDQLQSLSTMLVGTSYYA